MNETILITGANIGLGKETARWTGWPCCRFATPLRLPRSRFWPACEVGFNRCGFHVMSVMTDQRPHDDAVSRGPELLPRVKSEGRPMSLLAVAWDWYSRNREAFAAAAALTGGGLLAWGALQQPAFTSRRPGTPQDPDRLPGTTEIFSRAVEQLGSDKIQICIGGIYTLERFSRDSLHDYGAVMEVLTAFVRQRARWTEPDAGAARPLPHGVPGTADRRLPHHELPADVAAALTVIIRRERADQEEEDARLDLRRTNLRQASLVRAPLQRVNLSGANLVEVNLASANLHKANLGRANLSGANLIGAKLSGANLRAASLSGANFRAADLRGATLSWADLRGTVLSGADLRGATIIEAQLRGASLQGADFDGADLSGSDLGAAQLGGANLGGANLGRVSLREAALSRSNLAEAILYQADLAGADFRAASLQGADLSWADLSRANLSWADLTAAVLYGANLSGADLRGANLSGADIRGAHLQGACLTDAVLDGAIRVSAPSSDAGGGDANRPAAQDQAGRGA